MREPQEDERQHRDTRVFIARSVAGDLGAFRSLMERHQDYAFGIAIRLLHDRDDSEDVVQESFIRVWKNLARFRDDVKFTTWLYKIVVNVAYDRIKSMKRRGRVIGYLAGLFGGGDPPDTGDPAGDIETADLHEHAIRIAKTLPPKQYLVFHLRDVLDLTIEETAGTAGMTPNSVRVNLCHARRKIRAALERLQEDRS